MPCRPKLCQRLAAQLSHPPPPAPFGSNHIWISDDLLSEAFNRYVRVSHATRRYGSNVPGPLEARRRASKRRMGCMVAATSMGPPGGDFGALFGSGPGTGGGNAVESGWTWMAPGAQPAPTKTTYTGWNWGAKAAKPAAEWEQLLGIPRTGEELVEESREAFEELLQDLEDIGLLEASDVAILTEFLGSSADEPEAKNVSRLIQWLSGHSVSDPAWQEITVLICDKIKLASIDNEELLEVIRALPSALDWEEDESARQRLHGIYAAFAENLEDRAPSRELVFQTMFEEIRKTTQDAQSCSRLIAMLIKTTGYGDVNALSENVSWTLLAIHNLGAVDLSRDELLTELQMALYRIPFAAIAEVLRLATRAVLENGPSVWQSKSSRALTWLECVDPATFAVDHMPLVYAECAKRLTLSHIVEHVARRHDHPVDLARFLLRNWLPNTLEYTPPRSRLDYSTAANGLRSRKSLPYGLRAPSADDLFEIEEKFERLWHVSRKNAWLALVNAFRRKGFSYDSVVDDILRICKAFHHPTRIYRIFIHAMLRECELDIPTHVYISLVKHFLAKGENLLALKTFFASPSVAITDVPELPVALLEDESIKFNLYDMLLRKPDSVPMEWRETHKLDVTPGHIEVVHMTAHTVANSMLLRPSQAYRHVWALYRWLQDRGAPLQPLISRAIVTAGIIRPIKEHTWIPNQRLDYILSIVEKVEGVKMRITVEELATYMRSSIHDKVIAKRRVKEETKWMNKSTYMMGVARFRLKKWAKLKPVPTEDGRSHVVPSRNEEIKGSTEQLESLGDMLAPTRDVCDLDNTSSTPDITAWRPAYEKSAAETNFLDSATSVVDALTSEEMKPTNTGPKPSKSAQMETWASASDFPRLDDMSSTPISSVGHLDGEEREVESALSHVVAVEADAPPDEQTSEQQDVPAVGAARLIPWRSMEMETASKPANPVDDDQSVDQMYFERAEQETDE